MTPDSYVTFLSVGLQLLPVLWILLLVETTYLRFAYSTPTTADNRADRTYLLIMIVPLGVLAELVGLGGLAFSSRVFLSLGTYLLMLALATSLTVSGLALHRQLQPSGRRGGESAPRPTST